MSKGVTQTDLGKEIGVTFQQIQKYENGVNRIGSGRLLQIAEALGIELTALFEGSGDAPVAKQSSVYDHLARRDTLRLVQAFSDIDNTQIRQALVELVEKISGT